jgi:hypothetical protein
MGDDWKILLFLLALGFALRVFLVIYPETSTTMEQSMFVMPKHF